MLLVLLLNFNSIKVQLKPYNCDYITPSDSNFNSIKVQLKPPVDAFQHVRIKFQFHKGTIKTKAAEAEAAIKDISIP